MDTCGRPRAGLLTRRTQRGGGLPSGSAGVWGRGRDRGRAWAASGQRLGKSSRARKGQHGKGGGIGEAMALQVRTANGDRPLLREHLAGVLPQDDGGGGGRGRSLTRRYRRRPARRGRTGTQTRSRRGRPAKGSATRAPHSRPPSSSDKSGGADHLQNNPEKPSPFLTTLGHSGRGQTIAGGCGNGGFVI